MKSLAFLCLPLVLTGCVSGRILGEQPAEPAKSTWLVDTTGDTIGLRPLFGEEGEGVSLGAKGVWVSQGWYLMSYYCFWPRNNHKMGMISESSDDKDIYIEGGHRYRVECDPDELGKVNFIPE